MEVFFSHSVDNPHGWGLAIMGKTWSQVEKEPVAAYKSLYLKQRLTMPVEGRNVFGHIRYATVGNTDFVNCHPFTGKDLSGRKWTLIHNGTIFDYSPLDRYVHTQKGETDSERIFLYLIDKMNSAIEENDGQPLEKEERFEILNRMVCDMSRGNKLNLMIFDGHTMYIHTNCKDTMYYLRKNDSVMFSTKPVSDELWKAVPQTTLFGFRNGSLAFTGTDHHNDFVENKRDIDMLYLDFANL